MTNYNFAINMLSNEKRDIIVNKAAFVLDYPVEQVGKLISDGRNLLIRAVCTARFLGEYSPNYITVRLCKRYEAAIELILLLRGEDLSKYGDICANDPNADMYDNILFWLDTIPKIITMGVAKRIFLGMDILDGLSTEKYEHFFSGESVFND